MLNIFRGQRPDLTPAQIVAFIFAAIPYILVLIGVDIGTAKAAALDDLKVLALGLFGADAAIRIGRNYAEGKKAAGVDSVMAVAASESNDPESASPEPHPDDEKSSEPPSDVEEVPLPETSVIKAGDKGGL